MTHDLVHLARSLQLENLETAWAAAVQAPRPADAPRYGAAIEALCERDMAGRALSLATAMVEALAANQQIGPATDLALRVVRRGAHNEALARQLVALLQQQYGGEEWFELVRQRANLDPNGITAQAILEFDRLRRYTKGFVVYHAGGWGEGVVEGFDAGRREVAVRFASGRREDFPLDTVIDRFKPLDQDDLRAMKLQAPDELRRLADHNPSALIAKVARLYRGTVSSLQVKQELIPAVLQDKEWTAFWKRAKAAAAKDPWLKVEGSATRPTFVLRGRPVGLADEARQTLKHQNDLGERVGVLREYLARGVDEGLRGEILALAEETVAQALQDKKASHAHILDALLFLEEHGRPSPAPAAQELRALLIGPDGALHPMAIDRLATQASRELAARLLPEALGEHWVDRVVAILPDFPVSVVEAVVDQLVQHQHGARVLDVWDRVAPYPRRHPALTYLLGKLYADGVFDGRDDKPAPVTVGRVLLHLARVLNGERKGNSQSSRLLSRLTSLLAGKRGLLATALEGISREDLASYLGISERGGEDFPQEIVDVVLRTVADHYPDLTARPEKPFWERTEHIYSTREGLKRIREDYRVLVEEKIPANSKAIGAAAALGDLSENSEWDAAMEEQRNLTGRATAMDREIRSVKLIEDQDVPDDVVAPGTRVELVEEQTGQRRTYSVLGPWDVVDDHTINYRAPIAHGLLGRRVGEGGELPTPGGSLPVRIERIERIV